MKEIENMKELAEKLGDRGSMSPDKEYETVGEVFYDLIDLGNTDKVYASHDEHDSLTISDELKNTSITELDESKFESEIEEIIEQANIIIPISEKVLTENDIDNIKEDMISRGVDPEDLDL